MGILVGMSLCSCISDNKKTGNDIQPVGRPSIALSKKDTVQVLNLTNQFMTAIKERRYADAAGMLYEMKADDPFAKPQLLDNDQLKAVLQRLKAFPINDFSVSGYTFKEAADNEVRCSVTLSSEINPRDTRSATTIWYFKPVRYLGEWKLCFRNSTQGDRAFDAAR